MPKEKDGYRLNIELLNDRFPDKDMLNVNEVMQFTGKTYHTVMKHIRFNSMRMVSKADLARQISV